MITSNIHLVAALIADEERKRAIEAARVRTTTSAETVDRRTTFRPLLHRLMARIQHRAQATTTPARGGL